MDLVSFLCRYVQWSRIRRSKRSSLLRAASRASSCVTRCSFWTRSVVVAKTTRYPFSSGAKPVAATRGRLRLPGGAKQAECRATACCLAAARRGTRIAHLHDLVVPHIQLCSVAMLPWPAPAESRPAGRPCSPGSHRMPAFGSSASPRRCPGPYARTRTAGASRGRAGRGVFGCGAICSRPLRCSCGWRIGRDVRASCLDAVQPAVGRTRRSSRG